MTTTNGRSENTMRLVLLGLPPTTNNLYAIVSGRAILSAAGRSFHAALSAVARDACGSDGWTVHDGPVAVRITYHLGPYDRDVDGSGKVILDALSGSLYTDDRRVVLFVARKVRVRTGVLPYVSIVVRRLKKNPTFRPPFAPQRSLAISTTAWPPSTNNAYTISNGRRRKSSAGRVAGRFFAMMFIALVRDQPRKPVFTRAIRLRIRYGFVADRRDVDGSHKIIVDAARGILWSDDRQIETISIAKARTSMDAVIDLAAWEI